MPERDEAKTGLVTLGTRTPTTGRRALRLKPDLADAHVCRADVLMASNQPDRALAGYQEAIRLNPQLPPAHNNRGNALRELGRNQEALESYDIAIALKPDYAEAFVAEIVRGDFIRNIMTVAYA